MVEIALTLLALDPASFNVNEFQTIIYYENQEADIFFWRGAIFFSFDRPTCHVRS